MKTLILSLMILGSISALAQEISEFERGYKQGLKACDGQESSTWRCTLYFGGWQTSGFGNSKAEALNRAIQNCDKYEGKGSAAHACRENASKPNRCEEI